MNSNDSEIRSVPTAAVNPCFGDSGANSAHGGLVHPRNWDRVRSLGISFQVNRSNPNVLNDALLIRSDVYERPLTEVRDRIDDYSEILCAYVDGEPLATLRITLARRGSLDCCHYLPQALDLYAQWLGSASRFCAKRSDPDLRLARLLIEAVWLHVLPLGIRLDAINVHERGIAYYKRLGYFLLSDSFFIHPVWRTPSYVMVFCACDAKDGPLSHLFENVFDGPSAGDILSSLRQAHNTAPLRNSIPNAA